MNISRTLSLFALFTVLAAALTSRAAITTNYDSYHAGVISATADLNANNPIYGDMLTLNQGGELAFLGLTVYNSSSQSGSISKCLMTIYIYDNTIPYSGTGPINNPVLGVWQLPWDFPAFSGGALAPGAQKLLVWDFNGVGLVLPQNILITQQFTITQGTSTRNGVVLCNASPTGSSPNYFYFGSSAAPEGFYTSGGNGQLGYLVATIPTTGGTNNPPVANSQSVILTQDTSASITLTGSDPDSDPLTFNVATQPTHGFLSGAAPNLTYQPDLGYVGGDSFTFTVNDTHTDSVPATVSLTINPAPNGLVIIPQWDGSITGDPNAAAIIGTINSAIQILQTKYRDPVTVTIRFQEMGGGLGQSSTYIGSTTYSSFYNALVADSKTTNDTVALANVPGGSINPIDSSSTMGMSTANFRALGFNVNPPPGEPDSTISLNMSLMNITRPPINPSNYDLQAVVLHEIDEALGTSSGLGGGTTRPADLFRYSAPGVRNYTTAGDSANFSINGGTTTLVRYNQNSGGDYGDWWSIGAHTARVQDAFGTPGATPNLNVELTLLDVIGWDLAPPAPPAVFQSVNITNSQINFTWTTTYGRSYQVQSTTSLNPQNWQNTGSPVIAVGPTANYSENISGPQKFYRVALLPQPVPPPPSGLAAADKILTGPLKLETRYLLPAPGTAKAGQAEPTEYTPEPLRR